MEKEKVSDSTTELVRAAVREALLGIAPILKDVALTPEKLEALRKPYVDPVSIAREKRERESNRQNFLAGIENQKRRQQECLHKDDNEKWSISVVHNFPDRFPRGCCVQCHSWIEPEHWDYTAEGKAFRIPAHPLYATVEFLDRKS